MNMLGGRHTWALNLLRFDLLAADKKRARFTVKVPADLAGSTLRLIRQNACRAAGERDCKWWRQEEIQDFLDELPTVRVVRQMHPNTEYTVQEKGDGKVKKCRRNSCEGCMVPKVPLREISKVLFGESKAVIGDGVLLQDTSNLRDWMGAKRGMDHSTFNRMLVNALREGWLTHRQAISFLLNGRSLKATSRALQSIFNKLRKQTTPVHPSLEEVTQSIVEEHERLEFDANESAILLNYIRKSGQLPEELLYLLREN